MLDKILPTFLSWKFQIKGNFNKLQQLNNLSDIEFKYFIKIYKKFIAEPCYFLVDDTTLPTDNPLRFRKNLLK